MNETDFQAELAERIRDAGHELIKQADAIAGNIHLIRDCTITIPLGLDGGLLDEAPVIMVTHEFYTSRFKERLAGFGKDSIYEDSDND